MEELIVVAALFASLNANAKGCFLDGSNTIRCSEHLNGISGGPISNPDGTYGGYIGVSWPVYTGDTPEDVWRESNERWMRESLDPSTPYKVATPTVQHMRIDTPDHYPDVVCFDFYFKGTKRSQTCFDTMEITER